MGSGQYGGCSSTVIIIVSFKNCSTHIVLVQHSRVLQIWSILPHFFLELGQNVNVVLLLFRIHSIMITPLIAICSIDLPCSLVKWRLDALLSYCEIHVSSHLITFYMAPSLVVNRCMMSEMFFIFFLCSGMRFLVHTTPWTFTNPHIKCF